MINRYRLLLSIQEQYKLNWQGTHGIDHWLRVLDNLRDHDFDMLYYAIDRHSDGLIDGDITVRTCWDADRLDLGRVGIKPDAKYLCTDAGKLIANTGGYNGIKRYDSGR